MRSARPRAAHTPAGEFRGRRPRRPAYGPRCLWRRMAEHQQRREDGPVRGATGLHFHVDRPWPRFAPAGRARQAKQQCRSDHGQVVRSQIPRLARGSAPGQGSPREPVRRAASGPRHQPHVQQRSVVHSPPRYTRCGAARKPPRALARAALAAHPNAPPRSASRCLVDVCARRADVCVCSLLFAPNNFNTRTETPIVVYFLPRAELRGLDARPSISTSVSALYALRR